MKRLIFVSIALLVTCMAVSTAEEEPLWCEMTDTSEYMEQADALTNCENDPNPYCCEQANMQIVACLESFSWESLRPMCNDKCWSIIPPELCLTAPAYCNMILEECVANCMLEDHYYIEFLCYDWGFDVYNACANSQ